MGHDEDMSVSVFMTISFQLKEDPVWNLVVKNVDAI